MLFADTVKGCNMKTFSLSAIFLVFFLLIAFAPVAFAQDRRTLSEARRISGDDFPVSLKTRKGTRIFAATRPSAKMLNAIDSGLAELFRVARRNGYNKNLRFSDYTVFVARPDRTRSADGQYSPDIAVGAAQYAGSVYDKGGYIYVAGMVIGYNPGAFIIGEHTGDVSRVSDIVRFEGEHIVLYHNDRKRYHQTADHSKGGGHPILK